MSRPKTKFLASLELRNSIVKLLEEQYKIERRKFSDIKYKIYYQSKEQKERKKRVGSLLKYSKLCKQNFKACGNIDEAYNVRFMEDLSKDLHRYLSEIRRTKPVITELLKDFHIYKVKVAKLSDMLFVLQEKSKK